MNILHVGSPAGVGAALAYYTSTRCVLTRRYDLYNQSGMYPGTHVVSAPSARLERYLYYATVYTMARRADMLHVHGWHGMIRHMRTPYILHYHGTDARGTPPEDRRAAELGALAVVVATPDLLDCTYAQTPRYIPNPVDVEIFQRRPNAGNGKGLMILLDDQPLQDTMDRLGDMGHSGIDWTVRRRQHGPNPGWGVRYVEMPDMLAGYEYYCDLKMNLADRTWYEADSRTALEAMAVGVRTIRHDGSILDRLPDRHRAEDVAARVWELYNGVLPVPVKKQW